MKYAEKWDLTCFFAKGSFAKELKNLSLVIESLKVPESPGMFIPLLEKMQEVDLTLRQFDAFILCLQSQNVEDDRADQLRAEFASLDAKYQLFNNRFDHYLIQLDESTFSSLMQDSELDSIRFFIEERRYRAGHKLPFEKEDMITALSVDGFLGWGELYPQLVAEIKIPFEQTFLSFGQSENKMLHPDPAVREEIFTSLEKVWDSKKNLFSSALNHLAGFRLQTYAMRGWETLREPLFENRMTRATLDAMWSAVEQSKGPLLDFLNAKAALLGLGKLSWYDVEAPLFANPKETISYDQGVDLILESFQAFHPRMGEFAHKACTEKWIEAEDRGGKRPGGYCVAFPKSRQSRIFMTYSGTLNNVSTLAHELGHAYHTEMLDDLPSFAQHYRMNIAETASTFAEQIVSDALLQQAKTREEKLKILSDRIQRSVVFMMNIHARFLFEVQFYEMRKQNFVSAKELCQMMTAAQETAYLGTLERGHPYFWAAKLHFYMTEVPFYNFPYTFGYLFSLGLYSRAKNEGPSFAKRYDAVLRESGMMPVEELAKKHLGVDLAKPDFWLESCRAAVADVDAFLKLL